MTGLAVAMGAAGVGSVGGRGTNVGGASADPAPLVPRELETRRSCDGRASRAAPTSATAVGGGLATRSVSSRTEIGTMDATGVRAGGGKDVDSISVADELFGASAGGLTTGGSTVATGGAAVAAGRPASINAPHVPTNATTNTTAARIG